MSFYVIFKRMTYFAWLPGWNWICRPDLTKCGIRIGWLKWSLEVNRYDRNAHLKLVAAKHGYHMDQRTGLLQPIENPQLQ